VPKKVKKKKKRKNKRAGRGEKKKEQANFGKASVSTKAKNKMGDGKHLLNTGLPGPSSPNWPPWQTHKLVKKLSELPKKRR